jgi:hypothetical protein
LFDNSCAETNIANKVQAAAQTNATLVPIIELLSKTPN